MRGPIRVAIGAVALATALAACGGSDSTTDSGSGVEDLSIMVPADPGGGWDQTGRAFQKALDETGLAGGAEVTNVGGAGGTVGLAQLANQRGGGTTLMVTGLVMVGAVETNQSQARLEDTTPIARLTSEDLIVVVPAESPYQTVNDLVDDIVATGKDVAVTGGSAGGADHILAGLLLKDAGVPAEELIDTLNYIAYSGGGESLAALLGGQVDAGISGVGEYSEQVAAGELRALAVSGPERVEGIDAPTLTEAGYDVELTNWRGLVASGDISDEDRAALVDLVTDLHGSEEWKAELERAGWGDTFLAGDEFDAFLDEEISSVQDVLRDIGLVQ